MLKCTMRVVGLLVVASTLGFGDPAQADLVFGGFDLGRGGVMSLTDGSFTIQLRSELSAEFSGVSLAATSTLTDSFLTGLDVLFISSAKGNTSVTTPLTAAEQTALLNYVLAGGQAIIVVDNNTFGGPTTDSVNESFLEPFGLDSTGTLTGTRDGTITNPSHAVTNGPFGSVSAFRFLFPGWFDNLGPNADPLGTIDANGEVGLAVIDRGALSPTSGQVVFFSDTGPFIDFNDLFNSLDNKALALNSFVTPATVVPEPSTLALALWSPVAVAWAGRHWRRKRSGENPG
jgi:hypothetical protein